MPANAFTVIAEFATAAPSFKGFLKACQQDAAASLAHEKGGCLAFEVLVPDTHPSLDQQQEIMTRTVILHEVYKNRDAFLAHSQTPHFSAFEEAVAAFGANRISIRYLTQQPPL
ncbi:antibiotic biosynthesis monooxygenase [Formicincola oecophyllae]|uniref:Antibiotic biosynthesis monooxygenase n=1 Tax=Formicincola oecophyllae TaxID=2558361 RepID=A0A4Y6UAF9_9PROT|nr:antibiotic biosynthesis monooxygenase [Formicincola oecophyllae]